MTENQMTGALRDFTLHSLWVSFSLSLSLSLDFDFAQILLAGLFCSQVTRNWCNIWMVLKVSNQALTTASCKWV